MNFSKLFIYISIIFTFASQYCMASGKVSIEEVNDINRTNIESEEDRLRIQITAGLLANYEIEAKKLIDMVTDGLSTKSVQQQAVLLLDLSENVIDSAKFRLPQCDKYLTRSLALKELLNDISHDKLEEDYHHDGVLPKAPGECYHTKDLFVHPATVIVLTRDDPGLNDETKGLIISEITEVLGHTELVRQLVIY